MQSVVTDLSAEGLWLCAGDDEIEQGNDDLVASSSLYIYAAREWAGFLREWEVNEGEFGMAYIGGVKGGGGSAFWGQVTWEVMVCSCDLTSVYVLHSVCI